MGKSKQQKVKVKKKKESKVDSSKILALAKRYWYWLVVIPLLIVAIILFCYFQGYFDTDSGVILTTSAPFEIEIAVGRSYNMDVTASDGSEVTYAIKEGDAQILEIDGNVITPFAEGETRVVASAGDKSRIFLIKSTQIMISWKIPVGGKYSKDIIDKFVYSTFGLESYSISYDDTDIVNSEIENGKEEYFCGVSEGVSILQISNAGSAENSFPCGMIYVEVVDGLQEADVKLDQEFSINLGDLEIDYTDIYKTYDVLIGEHFEIDGIKFDKAGTYYYYQRQTDVLKISGVGRCIGVKEGDSIVTVLCISNDGTFAYTNVKVRVRPIKITINKYVGMEFSTADLLEMYDDNSILYYETTDTSLDVFEAPNGYAEIFTPNKAGETAIINAYNASGEKVVVFEVIIRPSEEYMGEE